MDPQMQRLSAKLFRSIANMILGGGILLSLGTAPIATVGLASNSLQDSTHHQAIRVPGSHHVPSAVANPALVTPTSCTFIDLGVWAANPSGMEVDISPNVYNCSGNYFVDSIDYFYVPTSGGVQLNNWWFYSNCGDFFSAKSASPNTFLSPTNVHYLAVIGLNVSNPNHFDQDTGFNPGGIWTACM